VLPRFVQLSSRCLGAGAPSLSRPRQWCSEHVPLLSWIYSPTGPTPAQTSQQGTNARTFLSGSRRRSDWPACVRGCIIYSPCSCRMIDMEGSYRASSYGLETGLTLNMSSGYECSSSVGSAWSVMQRALAAHQEKCKQPSTTDKIGRARFARPQPSNSPPCQCSD
jgi:hypothetical protein